MYLIDDLEKVQTRATKILMQCRRLNYRQRLEFLNLPTLAFRRNRGDMIEVYKILTGKYDSTLPSILHRNINSTTRGNPLKSCTYRLEYDLCKYNFAVRVISLWNSLPTHVITAVSVDSFQNRLGKFWAMTMRKHVLTTRPTYLAAVLQDASKSCVAFLLLYTIV